MKAVISYQLAASNSICVCLSVCLSTMYESSYQLAVSS